jgi:hypothetical protein
VRSRLQVLGRRFQAASAQSLISDLLFRQLQPFPAMTSDMPLQEIGSMDGAGRAARPHWSIVKGKSAWGWASCSRCFPYRQSQPISLSSGLEFSRLMAPCNPGAVGLCSSRMARSLFSRETILTAAHCDGELGTHVECALPWANEGASKCVLVSLKPAVDTSYMSSSCGGGDECRSVSSTTVTSTDCGIHRQFYRATSSPLNPTRTCLLGVLGGLPRVT